jgi:predicted MFS family arabinose efflux permease
VAAVGAWVIAVTYGLGKYAFGLDTPRLQHAFGLTATGIGLLGGLSNLGYGAGLLVAPPLSNRAARGTAVGAAAAAALGLGLVGSAPGPAQLAAGVFIGGASGGLASPSLAQLVQRRLAGTAAARTQTWINCGTSVGLAISAPAVLLPLAWRQTWALFAGAAFAIAVAAWVVLPTAATALPTAPPAPTERAEEQGKTRALLPATFLGSSLLVGLTSAPYWSFARVRVLEAGLTPGASSLFWLTIGVVGLGGGLIGGISVRTGLRAAARATWLLWAVALGLLALPSLPTPLAVLSAALFGGAYMAVTGVTVLWASRVRPGAMAGAVTAAFLCLAAGQAAGTPVAGALADHLGLAAVFAGAAALSLAGLALVPPRHLRA